MPLITTLTIIYDAVIDQNIGEDLRSAIRRYSGFSTAYQRKWLFIILLFYYKMTTPKKNDRKLYPKVKHRLVKQN